jgi:hypothetical protein
MELKNIPMFSMSLFRARQIFPNLRFVESGNINGLQAKKFGFAFFGPIRPTGAKSPPGPNRIAADRQGVNLLSGAARGR